MARVSSTLTIRTKETISKEVVSFFCMGGVNKGYEYVVEVKIIPVPNPPADASSAQYVLEKIISMEEKESDTPQLNLNFAAKQ